MVTHNPENSSYSSRAIFLRDGRVEGKFWKAELSPGAFSELPPKGRRCLFLKKVLSTAKGIL